MIMEKKMLRKPTTKQGKQYSVLNVFNSFARGSRSETCQPPGTLHNNGSNPCKNKCCKAG